MTISKERLSELAIECANAHEIGYDSEYHISDFAHALLKSVEQELADEAPVHIYPWDLEKFDGAETFCTVFSIPVGCPDGATVPLIALPLVSEE
jgi:hypothetical protein